MRLAFNQDILSLFEEGQNFLKDLQELEYNEMVEKYPVIMKHCVAWYESSDNEQGWVVPKVVW